MTPVSWYSYPCVVPSQLHQGWSLWPAADAGNDGTPLPKQVIRLQLLFWGVFPLCTLCLTFLDLSLWGDLPGEDLQPWANSRWGPEACQPPRVRREGDSLAPFKLWPDYNHSQQFDCNLMRAFEPEPPAKPRSDSWLRENVQRHSYSLAVVFWDNLLYDNRQLKQPPKVLISWSLPISPAYHAPVTGFLLTLPKGKAFPTTFVLAVSSAHLPNILMVGCFLSFTDFFFPWLNLPNIYPRFHFN